MTDRPKSVRLDQSDVARLMAGSSPDARVDTSTKIAAKFDAGDLSASERRIAEDIFRALAQDVELRVREALSAHLKSTPDLPHDVAIALARDVGSVALPMLKFSEVLTDADLIEIVAGKDSAKLMAIAQRRSVSARVSDAMVDTGNEAVVACLVGNEGAKLSESTLNRLVADYEDSAAVADSLARRSNLPAMISERLVAALAGRLQEYLVSKHDLSPDVASNLILQARERATVALIDYGSSDVELKHLIEQLYRKERLTPSLLLRALCMGDLNFFERAIARLADLPLQNVRLLVHDQSGLGLKPLCERAALPARLFPAFAAAVELVVETDYDGDRNDRERYVGRMLERMLTHFEDPARQIAPNDIEYLMAKLQHIAA
jgi:uncharacterized protein (DUF2336 family)